MDIPCPPLLTSHDVSLSLGRENLKEILLFIKMGLLKFGDFVVHVTFLIITSL